VDREELEARLRALDEAERLEAEQARRKEDYAEAQHRAQGFASAENQAWVRDFARRFNAAPKNRYGERMGIEGGDIDTYTKLRGVAHISETIARMNRRIYGPDEDN
jgi:hypothetical protein